MESISFIHVGFFLFCIDTQNGDEIYIYIYIYKLVQKLSWSVIFKYPSFVDAFSEGKKYWFVSWFGTDETTSKKKKRLANISWILGVLICFKMPVLWLFKKLVLVK